MLQQNRAFCLAFLFSAISTDASRASLADAVGEPLGIRIGRLVRSGAQAASTNAEFRQAFLDRWDKDHAQLVNENVSETIAHANLVADTAQNHALSSACPKNWEATCPDGWTHYPGSGVCRAPNSDGSCSRVPSDLAVAEKKQISVECSAPWPCQGMCSGIGTNYDIPCPIGWTNLPGGYCKAVKAGKSRQCPTIGKFTSMTVGQKQDLSFRCNLSWPCRTSCEQNFSATCPESWTEIEQNAGACAAPPSYAGDCEFIVNTAGMNVAQKRAFALRCSVEFPCAESS